MSKKSPHRKFSVVNFILICILIITFTLIISNLNSCSEIDNTKQIPDSNFSIGDNVILSDTEWVLLEAWDLGNNVVSNNIFIKDRMTSGKFIQIKFLVKNISKSKIDFNFLIDNHHPKLFDSENREFEYIDSMANFVPDGAHTTNSFSGETTIQSGMEKNFYAIYEVPKESSELHIIFPSIKNRTEKSSPVFLGF